MIVIMIRHLHMRMACILMIMSSHGTKQVLAVIRSTKELPLPVAQHFVDVYLVDLFRANFEMI